MERLKKLLAGYKYIAIDISTFIYYIKEDERYIDAADILFSLIVMFRYVPCRNTCGEQLVSG